MAVLCYSKYMIPRKNRIPTEQFPGVLRGKTLQNELFRVVIKEAKGILVPKCAVIVPNKVAKTAVLRNKVRRRIYDLLGGIIGDLPSAYISVFPKKSEITQKELICLKNLLVK